VCLACSGEIQGERKKRIKVTACWLSLHGRFWAHVKEQCHRQCPPPAGVDLIASNHFAAAQIAERIGEARL
jgi:hypothetical protein